MSGLEITRLNTPEEEDIVSLLRAAQTKALCVVERGGALADA